MVGVFREARARREVCEGPRRRGHLTPKLVQGRVGSVRDSVDACSGETEADEPRHLFCV